MRITVNCAELASMFAWVAGGLPSRPTLPVLQGMQLTAKDGTLTLAVFDYEQSRRGRAAGTGEGGGTILVDGPALKKIVASLPKGTKASPAAVTLAGDAETLTVSAGVGAWTLPALPAGEYPDIPELPALTGTVDGDEFARKVTRVAATAATDDTLPMLTCVQFAARPTELGVAATDRYRLAHDQLTWTPAGGEAPGAGFLVPARAAAAFAAKAGKHGNVTVHVGKPESGRAVNLVGFRDDARELTVRPSTAEYLRWRKVLRTKSPVNLTVGAKALADTLKQMQKVTYRSKTDRFGVIDLHYADGQLTVHALGDDLATTVATGSVPASADTAAFRVRFCPFYLGSVLDGIDGQAVIGLAGRDAQTNDLSGAPGDLLSRPKQATVKAASGGTFRAIVAPIAAAA